MELQCRPIGFLRCSHSNKFLTPRQCEEVDSPESWIELSQEVRPELSLRDLEGFSRIWVVFWFHLSRDWRPRVLPPRGRTGRKGLFATRSPHRPNPIGLSALKLLGVEPTRLQVGPHDLLDGTPILDIKPYLPRFDAFPQETMGWVAEVEAGLDAPPDYQVGFAAEAISAMANPALGADFQGRVVAVLERDPFPHRTRRISRIGSELRMCCGDWRVFFTVEGRQVRVHRVCHRRSRTRM